MTGYRLGVDVGGTFTDLLLIAPGGETFRAKVPSTPSDQSAGIVAGVDRVCAAAGILPARIGALMHGTTVATNAVLERRGARVGLAVTAGYRQVLQIGRSYVPGGLAGWIVWPKPAPLAALEDTVEVDERIGADGSVVRALDEESARIALRRLRDRGVEAITVSLINAFAEPAHEQRLRALAEQECPGLPVSLSSDILPEMREYERTLTTVANSYVAPTVARYLANLGGRLTERGIDARARVLRSDGGLMSFAAAAEKPVNLLMSGPAGGIAGALWTARLAGFDNLLTLDMGGTSTDVSLIERGEPLLRRETRVGDVTVRASSLDVRTVGAGGGSIARVNDLTGALRVGPVSAGAVPGPAAYGRGGTEPTVTDANVVLGYLPPSLLGGEMKLDREAARASVAPLADRLGVGVEEAAAGIVALVNEAMFGALRLVSVEQGFDPRRFALIAFGGAGPLHGNALGRLIGAWPVIVPNSPGVLCAQGDATTRARVEFARTHIRALTATNDDAVASLLEELGAQASAALTREGVAAGHQEPRFEIDMRYQGQGFDVPVPVTLAGFRDGGLARAAAAFDAVHDRLFTFKLDAEHELVNLRAVALGPPEDVTASPIGAAAGADASLAIVERTELWFAGGWQPAAIHDRARLLAGHVVPGPAIVTEMDSTTLVLPGHAATVDRMGNLLIAPVGDRP